MFLQTRLLLYLSLFNALISHAVAMPIMKHHDNKVNIVSKAAHSKHTTGTTFINLTCPNKQDNTSCEHQLWRKQAKPHDYVKGLENPAK